MALLFNLKRGSYNMNKSLNSATVIAQNKLNVRFARVGDTSTECISSPFNVRGIIIEPDMLILVYYKKIIGTDDGILEVIKLGNKYNNGCTNGNIIKRFINMYTFLNLEFLLIGKSLARLHWYKCGQDMFKEYFGSKFDRYLKLRFVGIYNDLTYVEHVKDGAYKICEVIREVYNTYNGAENEPEDVLRKSLSNSEVAEITLFSFGVNSDKRCSNLECRAHIFEYDRRVFAKYKVSYKNTIENKTRTSNSGINGSKQNVETIQDRQSNVRWLDKVNNVFNGLDEIIIERAFMFISNENLYRTYGIESINALAQMGNECRVTGTALEFLEKHRFDCCEAKIKILVLNDAKRYFGIRENDLIEICKYFGRFIKAVNKIGVSEYKKIVRSNTDNIAYRFLIDDKMCGWIAVNIDREPLLEIDLMYEI